MKKDGGRLFRDFELFVGRIAIFLAHKIEWLVAYKFQNFKQFLFQLRAYKIVYFGVENLSEIVDRAYSFFMVFFDDVALFKVVKKLYDFVIRLIQYVGKFFYRVAENALIRQRQASVGVELHNMGLHEVTQIRVFSNRIDEFIRKLSVYLLHEFLLWFIQKTSNIRGIVYLRKLSGIFLKISFINLSSEDELCGSFEEYVCKSLILFVERYVKLSSQHTDRDVDVAFHIVVKGYRHSCGGGSRTASECFVFHTSFVGTKEVAVIFFFYEVYVYAFVTIGSTIANFFAFLEYVIIRQPFDKLHIMRRAGVKNICLSVFAEIVHFNHS